VILPNPGLGRLSFFIAILLFYYLLAALVMLQRF
jgi:hypothetical protein